MRLLSIPVLLIPTFRPAYPWIPRTSNPHRLRPVRLVILESHFTRFAVTQQFIMSNQQPTGYSWRSPAGNPPTFGAPSSAPVGRLANTPFGAAFNCAGAGATATGASFANASIAPAPAPTGGSTTNPDIAPPGTAYGPTGAGTPAPIASFANAPVPAPTGGFATSNPYIAPPGAAYAPFSGPSVTAARFANAPYPSGNPHVAPPGYTYQHQSPQLPVISTGDSIPIRTQDVRQLKHPSTHAAPPPPRRVTLPYPTMHTHAMAPPAQPLALPSARFPTQSWYSPPTPTRAAIPPPVFETAPQRFPTTLPERSSSPQPTPPRRGLETTTIDLSEDVPPPPPPRPVYQSYPFHPSIMDETGIFSKKSQRIIYRFSTEIGERDLSRRFQGVVNPDTVTSLDMTNGPVIFAEKFRSGFTALPSWALWIDKPRSRDQISMPLNDKQTHSGRRPDATSPRPLPRQKGSRTKRHRHSTNIDNR